ncbi:hypothetical protein Tco_0279199, partial [Tanacetum coccineum]
KLSLIIEDEVESVAQCLISCSRVKPLWRKVWSWWQFDPSSSMSSVSVSDFACGNIGSLGNLVLKKIVHGVFLCVLWAIWRWRNNVCNAHPDRVNATKTEDIFSLIQRLSLLWISKRCSLKSANWNQWTLNPRGCVP